MILLHLFCLGSEFTPVCNTGSDTVFEHLCEYDRNTWFSEGRKIGNSKYKKPFPEPLNIVSQSQTSTALHKLKQMDPNSLKIEMLLVAALLAVTWNDQILSAELCTGDSIVLLLL
jgi:hypothetical protein